MPGLTRHPPSFELSRVGRPRLGAGVTEGGLMRSIILFCAAAALAGCNQAGEEPANNASANTSAAAAKHPTFCFFKDEETKDWKASADAKGVTVSGKAHVKDGRYKAVLGDPEIAGTEASVWLTIGTNDTGYSADEDWWDLRARIPPGTAVESVSVMCGKKTIAQLALKKG